MSDLTRNGNDVQSAPAEPIQDLTPRSPEIDDDEAERIKGAEGRHPLGTAVSVGWVRTGVVSTTATVK